ncbi:MAG: tRNA (adenosine(37)-N6)-dimethylallyltransferase MiaA [Acidimicrobiales bacterium]|nr:tRNA (adenosine(37)-N6)-dimethylallyltransferase MiaA [Acidimicrobiales bacterium]
MNPQPLALVGTTASGKSGLALAMARARPDIELVSVDSMQVYRGMDIGTAKPTVAERAEVPHHCIDLVDPWEEFTVAQFQQTVRSGIADVETRGKRPLLVGGTGLYLRAVIDDLEIPGRFPGVASELDAEPDTVALHARLRELDPVAADRMEPTNRRRVLRALEVTLGSGRPFSSYGPGLEEYPPCRFQLVGIRLPRSVIDDRIVRRYQHQLEAGFVGEVQRLLDDPRGWSPTASQALGYKELAAHLRGECTLDEALELALRRTRRFARRQERWFRRDPRIRWLDTIADPASLLDQLLSISDGE